MVSDTDCERLPLGAVDNEYVEDGDGERDNDLESDSCGELDAEVLKLEDREGVSDFDRVMVPQQEGLKSCTHAATAAEGAMLGAKEPGVMRSLP